MTLLPMLILCQFMATCPLVDYDRPEAKYPHYHNTRVESPIRKVDDNNYPRPVPLHEYVKKRLGSM